MLGSLSGRTFVSTEVKGHDLVAGSAISLSFPASSGPGALSANAGCNTMSGQAVVDGGVLRVPQLAMTQMGCSQALMAQETWFSGLLTQGVDLTVSGEKIVLAADGVTITLTDRTVVVPDLPFVGTTWTLDGIVRNDSVAHYADVTATMSTNGSEISYRACNSRRGPISITGDSATAGPMVGTKMACSDARADVEKAMDAVLDGTFTVTVDGNHLTLTGADGAGLIFVGAADDTPTSPSDGSPSGGTPSGGIVPIPPSTAGAGPTGTPAGSVSPATPVTPTTAAQSVSGTAPSRSPAGQHDSVPPQPTPNGATGGN